MTSTDTRIPVSKGVRRELKILKAREDRRSYDETLSALIDAYDQEEMTA